MYITRIKANNFVLYRKLDLKLPSKGLIGIEGVNLDEPVMISNAVGKTLLEDIVSYVTWGEVIRKKRANIVGPFDDSMSATVYFFERSTRTKIMLRRKRSKTGGERVVVRVGSREYKGTPTKLQPIIDKFFGMGWLTARNCVIYGDSIEDAFIYSTDNKRKEIMAEIANILFLRAAKTFASTKKKQCDIDLAAAKSVLSIRESEVSRAKENIKEAKEKIDDERIDIKREMKKIEKQITFHEERQKKFDKIEIEESIVLCKGKIKDLEDNIVEAEDKLATGVSSADIESEIKSEQKIRDEVHFEKTVLDKNIRKLIKDGECITCKTKTDKLDLKKLKNNSKELGERLITLDRILKGFLLQLDSTHKAEARIVRLRTMLSDAQSQEKDLALKFSQAIAVEKDIKLLRMELKAVTGKRTTMTDNLAELKAELNTIKQRFGRAFFAVTKAKTELEGSKFWVERYSQRGLEADFISDLVNELSNHAGGYINRLTDGNIGVTITPYKAMGKKTKSEIVIDVTHNGKTKDFRIYSGGQKNRIERAINLGLMNLVSDKIEFKMFDEIGKNLPPKGYERVILLMKDIFEGQQVLLITHETEMRKYFDHRIVVTLEGGEATARLI